MYDINKKTWMSICLFNTVASSRWGHSMCTVESANDDDYQANSVVIFGGINLNSYQNTMFELIMDKERINQYFNNNLKKTTTLEQRYSELIDLRIKEKKGMIIKREEKINSSMPSQMSN